LKENRKMAIPIMSPIFNFVRKKVLWRVIKFSVIRLAKIFVGKYKPSIHAKKSRKWEWENGFKPMIEKANKTSNPVDDAVLDYVYYHQACYIEDGSLETLLRCAAGENEAGRKDLVEGYLQRALDLIVLPSGCK